MNLSISPRLPGDRAFIVIAAISTVGLTILRTHSMDAITRWWIAAFEIAILVRTVLPLRPWSALRTHLVIALALCLGGDLVINWTSHGIHCIAFFALTHVNLLWIFARLRRPKFVDLPFLFPWCIASVVVFGAVESRLPKIWMAPVLGAYLLLLDFMVWRALLLIADPRPRGARLLAFGGTLFFATDHLVVLQVLYPAKYWVVATWICYPPALSLLALASRCLGTGNTNSAN